MSPALDDLARALGQARAAHEARPNDRERERRFLEARCAFLEAERARLDGELKAAWRLLSGTQARIARLEREFSERLKAVFPAAPKVRRRASSRDAGAPLLEAGR